MSEQMGLIYGAFYMMSILRNDFPRYYYVLF